MLVRSLFDGYGLFDETLPACEDYDLWLRLSAKLPFRYLPKPLIVKYGGHRDQLSRTYPAMDRYRITAIVKLLRSGVPNTAQTALAVDALERKARVYAGGLKKRSKYAELSALQQQTEDWISL